MYDAQPITSKQRAYLRRNGVPDHGPEDFSRSLSPNVMADSSSSIGGHPVSSFSTESNGFSSGGLGDKKYIDAMDAAVLVDSRLFANFY